MRVMFFLWQTFWSDCENCCPIIILEVVGQRSNGYHRLWSRRSTRSAHNSIIVKRLFALIFIPMIRQVYWFAQGSNGACSPKGQLYQNASVVRVRLGTELMTSFYLNQCWLGFRIGPPRHANHIAAQTKWPSSCRRYFLMRFGTNLR